MYNRWLKRTLTNTRERTDMGRKQIQIVAETTSDGPAVITAGPVALIGRSVDIKQGYKSVSVLVSELATRDRGGLQVESLFEHLQIPWAVNAPADCGGGILPIPEELDMEPLRESVEVA